MDNVGSFSLDKNSIGETLKLIQYQAAMQQQEVLIQTINDKCFKMCVQSPGSSLDNSQQKCLAKCLDRYVDSWNCVSKTVTNKIRSQASMMQE